MKEKKSLSDYNFLFESQIKSVYSHFVNVEFNFVNVRNDNDFLFVISHYYKINLIIKYEIKEVYFVNLKNHFLIVKSSREKKSMFFKFINLFNLKSTLKKIKINLILKIKLFNNITIYEK